MKNNKILKEYLFLFDIDGTILESTGAGKKAFIKAFEDIVSAKIEEDINFRGGIDNIIFKKLYNKYSTQKQDTELKWNEFKKNYIKLLLSSAKQKGWKLFKNAKECIKFLSKNSNIALVTGNIKEGAKIKLESFDLYKYFPCGGYGDNAVKRKDIVKTAIKESKKFYQKKFSKKNIFLFGDTKKDMTSANKNRIASVLIDPYNAHLDNAKKLKAKYHGNFENIDNFFEIICSQRKPAKMKNLNPLFPIILNKNNIIYF